MKTVTIYTDGETCFASSILCPFRSPLAGQPRNLLCKFGFMSVLLALYRATAKHGQFTDNTRRRREAL